MKKIGITQRVVTVGDYGERRDCLDQKWSELMTACGFVPVPLSNMAVNPGDYVKALGLDGVILTGGEDLQEYGGPEDSRERDAFERGLVEYCAQQDLPVIGVCRGLQLLNVCHGGDLAAVQGHVGGKHELEILDPEFLGEDRLIRVNSFHHFSIAKGGLADNFKALAVSGDGHIEAFSDPARKCLGIMWHPEREDPFEPRDIAMICKFFQADD